MTRCIVILLLICVSVNHLNGQSAFNMVEAFPNNGFNPNPGLNQLQQVTFNRVKSAFTYISKQSNMEFNYPQGGCPERAHVMHYLLDSLHIPNFKIWLFAPSRLIVNNTDRLFILDKNSLSTEGNNKINWDYHVAPCVLSSNATDKPDTMVLDPAIDSEKPLKVQEWIEKIGNRAGAKYSFIDGKYYSFFRGNGGSSNVINGVFYAYEGLGYNSLWIEKMMALNQTAYLLYLKYVKNKDRSNQRVKDIIAIIGNSATLKEVLDYKDGEPAASKLRYIAAEQPEFITEAWTIYCQNLAIWIKRMKTLKS